MKISRMSLLSWGRVGGLSQSYDEGMLIMFEIFPGEKSSLKSVVPPYGRCLIARMASAAA